MKWNVRLVCLGLDGTSLRCVADPEELGDRSLAQKDMEKLRRMGTLSSLQMHMIKSYEILFLHSTFT
jgi:hypothetical protein